MTAPGRPQAGSSDARQGKNPVESMKARRDEGIRRRNQLREARWREQRLAVPYPTDGPKITLGILWAVAVVGGAWLSIFLLAVVVVAVAAVAGLQVGHTFGPPIDRRATAAAAAIVGACGLGGALGAGIGVIVGVGGIAAFVAGTLPEQARSTDRPADRPAAGPGRSTRPRIAPSRRDVIIGVTEMMVRSAIPVGVVAASLIAIGKLEFSGLLALVLLVSAYEAGDFLIGTGSANAVEGPVAGIVALIVASAGLYLVLPSPFSTDNFPLFALLTAAAAPLGQIAASAVLPRGDSWAPALRRLDSYLLAAPLWLLLLPRI